MLPGPCPGPPEAIYLLHDAVLKTGAPTNTEDSGIGSARPDTFPGSMWNHSF